MIIYIKTWSHSDNHINWISTMDSTTELAVHYFKLPRKKPNIFSFGSGKNSGSSGLLWSCPWFWIASAVLRLPLQLWSIDILIHLWLITTVVRIKALEASLAAKKWLYLNACRSIMLIFCPCRMVLAQGVCAYFMWWQQATSSNKLLHLWGSLHFN